MKVESSTNSIGSSCLDFFKVALDRFMPNFGFTERYFPKTDEKGRLFKPPTSDEKKFSNHVFECIGSTGQGNDKELIFKLHDQILKEYIDNPNGFYSDFCKLLRQKYPLTILAGHVDGYANYFFGWIHPSERVDRYVTNGVTMGYRLKWVEHVLRKMGFALLDDQGKRYTNKNIANGEQLPTIEKLRIRLPTPATIERRWQELRNDWEKAKKYGITEESLHKLKERVSIALAKETIDSVRFVTLLNGEHHDVVVDNGTYFMHDLLSHVIPTISAISLEATNIPEKYCYTPLKRQFDEVILDFRNRMEEETNPTIKIFFIEFLSRLADSASASFFDCKTVRGVLLKPLAFRNFALAESPQYMYGREWKSHLRAKFPELSDQECKANYLVAVERWLNLCHQNPHVIERNRPKNSIPSTT